MRNIFNVLLLSLFVFISQAQNRLTPETLWHLGRVGDIQLSPDQKKVLFGVTTYDIESNKGNRDLYLLDIKSKSIEQLTDLRSSDYNGRWRPDGKKIGFLSEYLGGMQIWEMNPDGSEKTRITDFPGGINGFDYAPDMRKIVFIADVKMDKTANEIHADLPKANARIIDDLMYRHWNQWDDFAYSHVFVAQYHVDGRIKDPVDLMKGHRFDTPLKPWGGMEQIAFSPDGAFLAYTCKRLEGREYTISTNSDIFLVDLNNNTTRNISSFNEGYDKSPVFSPDGTKLVWQSMKTPGFEADKERIILFDIESGEHADLTENFDQSASSFFWDETGRYLYFISGTEATYQIYKMNIEKKDIVKITSGIHNYTEIQPANNFIIGAKMSMSMPTEIFKVDIKSGKEDQLSFINEKILSDISLGKVEKEWIKTTDGKEMLTWIIYPPNFDPTRKYPALLYCQGGPQSAVSQFFSYRWNFQIMAANDYIVIAPNRRGLPTFGQEWNDQISGDYGGQNIQDYLSATDAMSKKAFIDADRMGAVGASYGGFSVFYLAGHHEGRFKAFISHCGMFNLESWYGSTEEMFFANHDLGGPYWQEEKPKSYDFSPHKFVDKWDTPIMIITGAKDFRIPYTESLQAFNAAQLRNIPSELLFFPEETHFVLKPQNSILWQREFFKWLDKWLK